MEMDTKTEKRNIRDVCVYRIILEGRRILPFIPADRYDPKDACKYTSLGLKSQRKFYLSPQSLKSLLPKFHLKRSRHTKKEKINTRTEKDIFVMFASLESFFERS